MPTNTDDILRRFSTRSSQNEDTRPTDRALNADESSILSRFSTRRGLIDGDTYREDENVDHRITGMDTPETPKDWNARGSEAGYLSQEATQALMDNGATLDQTGEYDKYGRQLSTLRDGDGRDLSLDMIQAGLAERTGFGSDDEKADAKFARQQGNIRELFGYARTENDTLRPFEERARQLRGTWNPFENSQIETFSKDRRGTFAKGVDRGVGDLTTVYGGFTNWLGDVLENEDLKEYGREFMRQGLVDSATSARSVEDFSQIDSIDDALDYLLDTAGEMAPSLLADAAAFTGGAVAGAGVGGFAALGAKKTLETAAKSAVLRAAKRGAISATAASGFIQSVGDMETRLEQRGSEDNVGASLTAGLVGGAMNALPIAKLLPDFARSAGLDEKVTEQTLEKFSKFDQIKKRAGDVAKTTLRGAKYEGITSAVDEAMKQTIEMSAMGDEGWNTDAISYIDDVIRATLGGGMATAGGSVASNTVGFMREYSAYRSLFDADGQRVDENNNLLDENGNPLMEEYEVAVGDEGRAISDEDVSALDMAIQSEIDPNYRAESDEDYAENGQKWTRDADKVPNLSTERYNEIDKRVRSGKTKSSTKEVAGMVRDGFFTEEELARYLADDVHGTANGVLSTFDKDFSVAMNIKALDRVQEMVRSKKITLAPETRAELSDVLNNPEQYELKDVKALLKKVNPKIGGVIASRSGKLNGLAMWDLQTNSGKETGNAGDPNAETALMASEAAGEINVAEDKPVDVEKQNKAFGKYSRDITGRADRVLNMADNLSELGINETRRGLQERAKLESVAQTIKEVRELPDDLAAITAFASDVMGIDPTSIQGVRDYGDQNAAQSLKLTLQKQLAEQVVAPNKVEKSKTKPATKTLTGKQKVGQIAKMMRDTNNPIARAFVEEVQSVIEQRRNAKNPQQTKEIDKYLDELTNRTYDHLFQEGGEYGTEAARATKDKETGDERDHGEIHSEMTADEILSNESGEVAGNPRDERVRAKQQLGDLVSQLESVGLEVDRGVLGIDSERKDGDAVFPAKVVLREGQGPSGVIGYNQEVVDVVDRLVEEGTVSGTDTVESANPTRIREATGGITRSIRNVIGSLTRSKQSATGDSKAGDQPLQAQVKRYYKKDDEGKEVQSEQGESGAYARYENVGVDAQTAEVLQSKLAEYDALDSAPDDKTTVDDVAQAIESSMLDDEAKSDALQEVEILKMREGQSTEFLRGLLTEYGADDALTVLDSFEASPVDKDKLKRKIEGEIKGILSQSGIQNFEKRGQRKKGIVNEYNEAKAEYQQASQQLVDNLENTDPNARLEFVNQARKASERLSKAVEQIALSVPDSKLSEADRAALEHARTYSQRVNESEGIQKERKGGTKREVRVIREKSIGKMQRFLNKGDVQGFYDYLEELGLYDGSFKENIGRSQSRAVKFKQAVTSTRFGLRSGTVKQAQVMQTSKGPIDIQPLVAEKMEADELQQEAAKTRKETDRDGSKVRLGDENMATRLARAVFDVMSDLAQEGYTDGRVDYSLVVYEEKITHKGEQRTQKYTLAGIVNRLRSVERYRRSQLEDPLYTRDEFGRGKVREYGWSIFDDLVESGDIDRSMQSQFVNDADGDLVHRSELKESWSSIDSPRKEQLGENVDGTSAYDADDPRGRSSTVLKNATSFRGKLDGGHANDPDPKAKLKAEIQAVEGAIRSTEDAIKTVSKAKSKLPGKDNRKARQREQAKISQLENELSAYKTHRYLLNEALEAQGKPTEDEQRKLADNNRELNLREARRIGRKMLSEGRPKSDADTEEKRPTHKGKTETISEAAAKAGVTGSTNKSPYRKVIVNGETRVKAIESYLKEQKIDKRLRHRKGKARKPMFALVRSIYTRLHSMAPDFVPVLRQYDLDDKYFADRYRSQLEKTAVDATTLAKALKDLQDGTDSTEAKRLREFLNKLQGEMRQVDPDYNLTGGVPVVLDMRQLMDADKRKKLREILTKAKYENVDDIVDQIEFGDGVMEHAPSDGIGWQGKFSRQSLKPVAKELREAGLLEKDAPRIFNRFIHSAAKRYAYKNNFEKNDALKNMRASVDPRDHAEFDRLMSGVMGQMGRGMHRYLNTFNSVTHAFFSATLLMLSGIAQLPEFAAIAARHRGEMKTFGESVHGLMRSIPRQEALKFALDMDVITQNTMQDAVLSLYSIDDMNANRYSQWVSEKVFELNGTNWITRVMRTMAATGADQFMKHHAAKDDERSRRLLAELGIDKATVDAFNKEGDVNSKVADKYRRAVHQFVNESVTNPRSGQMPLIMNDPRYTVITMFKKFFYGYYDNVHKSYMKELRANRASGNVSDSVKMAMMLAAVALPMAAMSEWLREFFKYPFGRPEWQKEKGYGFGVQDVVLATGILGPMHMAQLPYESHEMGKDAASVVAMGLGPSFSFVDRAVRGDLNPSDVVPLVSQTPWLRNPLNEEIKERFSEDSN